MGPHYDSINETVIPAVKNAATYRHLSPCSCIEPPPSPVVLAVHLPRTNLLPAHAFGAIMNLP